MTSGGRNYLLALFICLLATSAFTGPARAQDALVLGGGGALGLTHGGVLLALDSLGYEPELVVGTSMGANIGAAYAAGYPPLEIWEFIKAEDWPGMFAPVPTIIGPERRERYPTLELDIAGARLTRGLLPDWRINRALTRLLFDAGARAGGDFDSLPRRFRAVAARLTTGEVVVLDRGDLARAVRASMAVPGVFAAVEWGSEHLIDGGVADNLPTGVARQLGADWVLAVDVTRPDPTITEMDPVALARRGFRLLMRNAQSDTLPPDVLILPQIDRSLAETAFMADLSVLQIAGLAATLNSLDPCTVPAKRPDPRPAPKEFSSLEIQTNDDAITALVESAFGHIAPGPYDTVKVFEAMDRLYATGLFQGVWPSTTREPDRPDAPHTDSPPLVVRTEALPRMGLLAAGGYDNDRGGRGWVQVEGWRGYGVPVELAVSGSFSSLDKMGEVAGRYYSRKVPVVWALGAYMRQRTARVFDGQVQSGEEQIRRGGGWLSREFRRISPPWSAAAAFHAERIWRPEGNDPSGWSFGPLFRVGMTESPATVVGIGSGLEVEARYGDVSYQRAWLTGSRDATLGSLRLAVVTELEAVRGDAPLDVKPALGNRFAMPGMLWGQERGRIQAIGGADLAHPFVADTYVRLRIRGGDIRESSGQLFRQTEDRRAAIGGVELGVLWATPLGLLSVAASGNTEGGWRWQLGLGPDY